MTTTETVASIAAMVGGRVVGDGGVMISGVGDVRQAGPGLIGFVRDPAYAAAAASTRAGALLVAEEIDAAVAQIVVADPFAAFATVAIHFHPMPRAEAHLVHPAAVVDPTAELGSPCEIGPGVVVGAGARIGAGSVVHSGCSIGAGVVLGADCTLFPRVVVYPGVRTGDRCIVHAGAVLGSDGFGYVTDGSCTRHKLPQVGTLLIGDDVEIGANTTIDRGALTASEIGEGVKIDNHCHIGHNCRIGPHTSISAFAAFATQTVVGARCTFGGSVRSGGHVTVCDDVILGGGAALVHDVTEPGIYADYPLQGRTRANRSRLLRGKLPDLAADVRELKRAVRELRERFREQ